MLNVLWFFYSRNQGKQRTLTRQWAEQMKELRSSSQRKSSLTMHCKSSQRTHTHIITMVTHTAFFSGTISSREQQTGDEAFIVRTRRGRTIQVRFWSDLNQPVISCRITCCCKQDKGQEGVAMETPQSVDVPQEVLRTTGTDYRNPSRRQQCRDVAGTGCNPFITSAPDLGAEHRGCLRQFLSFFAAELKLMSALNRLYLMTLHTPPGLYLLLNSPTVCC